MVPAPALVGLALVKAFATPSRMVVPLSEAGIPVPGPQDDQDQDMGGHTATPSKTSAANLSSGDTTVVDHITMEPMEVESPLSLLLSKPELAQEGVVTPSAALHQSYGAEVVRDAIVATTQHSNTVGMFTTHI
ncbi:hypothetical protein BDN67DRAFT_984916 [Paxillus ammoniavirescens]|nr:hypothetical protein BDN67DRAFT_984916 [Paxillus ammoniavirescens]